MTDRPEDSRDTTGNTPPTQVKVWDIVVRVFHWTVVVAFFVAYVTEDDLLTLHVWAGYTVGAVAFLRILWGFVGPRHARFTDFVYRPAVAWRYLGELLLFRARRYLGHSPAGGLMVVALLAGLLATVWSGLELYAVDKNAGPLAESSPPVQLVQVGKPLLYVNGDETSDRPGSGENSDSVWEEVHELLADLVLILVVLHITGVLWASLAHRENLVRSMVTGRKRPLD